MRSYDAKYIFFSAGGGLRMCVGGGEGGGGPGGRHTDTYTFMKPGT